MNATLKGFIMASKTQRYDIEKMQYMDEMVFLFSHYDSSRYNKEEVMVCEHSFDVEVPDGFDPRAGLVANLEREKKKITAEYQARITEINGQIQSLLAIENRATA
jgi:hypothetical protein